VVISSGLLQLPVDKNEAMNDAEIGEADSQPLP